MTDKIAITIRIPKELKKALSDAAHDNRTSFNEHCIRVLSGGVKSKAEGKS